MTYNWNPLKYIDPDGKKIKLTGQNTEGLLKMLSRSIVSKGSLSIDNEGYVRFEGEGKMRKRDERIMSIMNDENITVNINSSTRNKYGRPVLVGSFDGNNTEFDVNGNLVTNAYQSVNMLHLEQAEAFYGNQNLLLHEITEAYEGAKIAQGRGLLHVGDAVPTDATAMGVYVQAHSKAFPQPSIYRDPTDSKFYFSKKVPIYSGGLKIREDEIKQVIR